MQQQRIARLEAESAAARGALRRQGKRPRQALETIARQAARIAEVQARLAKGSPTSSKAPSSDEPRCRRAVRAWAARVAPPRRACGR